MKKLNQNGFGKIELAISALIIVVIILLGAISYAVYSELKDEQKEPTITSVTAKEDLKTDAIDSKFPIKVSFKYPSNWKLERELDGVLPLESQEDVANEDIKISDPSGKYTVIISAHNLGKLTSCSPAEVGKVFSFNASPLEESKNVSFVESIEENDQNKNMYYLYAGLAETSQADKAKAGDSICNIATAKSITRHKNPEINIIANIIIKGVNDELSGGSKINDLKLAMKTGEYDQAKQIIKSIKIED